MTKRTHPSSAYLSMQAAITRDHARLASTVASSTSAAAAAAATATSTTATSASWLPRVGQTASASAEQWALAFAHDPASYLGAEPGRAPWPSQLTSLARLLECECAILGDKAGGGKTDTIALLVLRDGQARVRRWGADVGRFGHMTLIVVPSHLLTQWQQRLRKWYPPHALAVAVVRPNHGTTKTARLAMAALDLGRVEQYVDVVLVTIDTLVAAAPAIPEVPLPFFRFPWYRVVVDEADMITNPESDRFRAIAWFDAGRRVFVSATPFRNARLTELNAIFTFLGVPPAELVRNDQDEERRSALLQRFFICSTGGGTHVPMETRWITTDNDHERYVYEGWAKIRAGDPATSLRLDTTLRKACQSIAVLSKPEDRPQKRLDYGPTRKIRALLLYERDELAADEMALVFNQWVQPLEEIAYWLGRYGVRYLLFRRGMKADEREALVQRICAMPVDERPRLILISLLLASGIDGFQHVANVVLLFSPYWTPAPEIQALFRLDRPGQLKKVLLNTIEDHVHETGKAKTLRVGQWDAEATLRRDMEEEEEEDEDDDDAL